MKNVSCRQSIVEAIGTFLLAFGVGVSVTFPPFPVPTVILAGLILGIAVYTIGPISGAQINPAVTIGLLSIRKISIAQAIGNIVAQLIAGLIAFLLLKQLGMHNAPSADTLKSFLGELLGAFVLMWGISAVVAGKVHSAASGITIGGSLSLGISVALFGSLGVLNPAVAIGVGAFSLFYFVAPIIGALFAAQLYSYIILEKTSSKK